MLIDTQQNATLNTPKKINLLKLLMKINLAHSVENKCGFQDFHNPIDESSECIKINFPPQRMITYVPYIT